MNSKRFFGAAASHGHDDHHHHEAPKYKELMYRPYTFTPAEKQQFLRQVALEQAERKHFGPAPHEHRVFQPPYNKRWTGFVMGTIIVLGIAIPSAGITFQQKKQGYWK